MPEVDAIIPVAEHTRAMDTVVGAEAAMAVVDTLAVVEATMAGAADMPAAVIVEAAMVAVTAVAAPEAEVTGNHRAAQPGTTGERDG